MTKLTHFPGYPPGIDKPVMQPEGTGASRILAMGEALGEHEELERLPFRPQAPAGSVLERALYRAGVPRDSLTLTNVVWYRPPRNWLDKAPWEADAISVCKPLNDELVAQRQPKVILALGGIAFRELTGMVGHKQGIELCRGFIVPSIWYPGIPVVGTYHPSFLHRGSKQRQKEAPGAKVESAGGGTMGMALLGALIRDIQLVQDIAKNGAPKFQPADYTLGATLSDWQMALAELRESPQTAVYYDFETRDSLQYDSEEDIELKVREATQVQIMYGEQVLVSPWFPELLSVLREILELPNPKMDWNGRQFDRPILRDMQIRTDLGEWHDLMDMWHHAQPDLPRGLQVATSFFCPEVGPWKHFSGSDPLYYGALDVHMPKLVYEGLKKSMGMMRNPQSGVSLLQGYQRQLVALSPELDRMTVRGIGIDNEKRLGLDKEFEATLNEVDAKIQALAPEEIRNVEPKEGYKRNNKLPRACLEAAGQTVLFGTEDSGNTDPVREAKPSHIEDCGTTYVLRKFKDSKTHKEVERWARLQPFLPNGHDQVIRYLKLRQEQDVLARMKARAQQMGKSWEALAKYDTNLRQWATVNSPWVIPINHKTSQETTQEEGLRKLAKNTGDPLIPLVLEYREVGKARSTYVQGWEPQADGRVHPFFLYKPATGQISSQNPNGQNFPKHAKIARAMRRMIVASPGHHLVELDYKGFHILTLGFEAADPLYIRLGRIDMHSFFVLAGMLRLEPFDKLVDLTDAELGEKLAWYRSHPKTYSDYGGRTFGRIRDEIGKHAILAYGNGQQPRGLFMKNRDAFATLKDAEKCQSALDKLFPKPFEWKKTISLQADRQAHLISRYGYVRWFWDVFNRRPVGWNYQTRPGEVVIEGKNSNRWLLAPGDDHEAAISYLIQNDAFGIKRGAMVALGESGLDEKFGMVTEIHDSLVFDCPDKYLDECIPTVKGIMEKPSPFLVDPEVSPEGLWCGTEVTCGRNWDKRDKENPEGMEKIRC